MRSERPNYSARFSFFVLLTSIATILSVIAIWTDDEHWADTAWLAWALTAIPILFTIAIALRDDL